MSFFGKLGDELGEGIGRGSNKIVSWFFTWERKPEEHPLHTNTARIALWSLSLALLFVPGLVTCSFNKKEKASTVTVYVQLKEEKGFSTFPSNEYFRSTTKEGSDRYIHHEDYFLYLYKENNDGKIPIVTAIKKMCVIVPEGREIKIFALDPPVYVINMEDNVTYLKQYEALNFFQKINATILSFFLKTKSYQTSNRWEYLASHWSETDHIFNLYSKALSRKKLGSDVGGGFVCF